MTAFLIVHLPTSNCAAEEHSKEQEDWALGWPPPDADHVVLRKLCGFLGTWCSHLQHEENGYQMI